MIRNNKPKNHKILTIFLLFLVVIVGGYFRFSGINWDENFHLHPDERFLTMVESSITPVRSISEYFNTDISRLNPHNVGYSFFVYGTFPIFLTRYIAEWLGFTGYDQIFLVGRYLSGVADLFTVIIVFLIAKKLYKNEWLSLVAASFAALSVLPIQQAHFFTVDSITNCFTTLSIYFAVCVLKSNLIKTKKRNVRFGWFEHLKNEIYNLKDYIYFGIALGLSTASKINSIIVCSLLPLAIILRNPGEIFNRKTNKAILIFKNLCVAAVFCIIVFRIFQPYAFSGPSFFEILPNPKWIDNLKELSYLSSGDSNYPPSLQWARRSVFFGLENIVNYGFGLPLGITALLSLLLMGWRIFRGEWKAHSLIWSWTVLYLIWQSLRWNPTMRYFLPIYPILAIISAWGLFYIGELKRIKVFKKTLTFPIKKIANAGTIIIVLSTFAWAFAFVNIYSRPVTRVQASQWIYQNIEGAINLIGEVNGQRINIPLVYPHSLLFTPDEPLIIEFTSNASGIFSGIKLDHLVDPENDSSLKTVQLTLLDGETSEIIDIGQIDNFFLIDFDTRGNMYEISGIFNVAIEEGRKYKVQISMPEEAHPIKFFGNMTLLIDNLQGRHEQIIYKAAPRLNSNENYSVTFSPQSSMVVNKLQLFRVKDFSGSGAEKHLQIELIDLSTPNQTLSYAGLSNFFESEIDFRGSQYTLNLESPVNLLTGHTYQVLIRLLTEDATLFMYGSQQANETSWDDAVPLLMYGINAYDHELGLYQSDLNFEMYWDDNPEKLARFKNILEQADYIYITSNRQWGSITQLPERYPLTAWYYRNLIGCPSEYDIQWCYRVATPGMFSGSLGFDLIQIFQSDPSISNFAVNTQFAEEAFTVYDHPKVFIFKKNQEYSLVSTESILSKIDLTKVLNLTPAQANRTPGTLEFSEKESSTQEQGGTWSDYFQRNFWINANPLITTIVWYLTIMVLGWIVYPLVRIAFGGLDDKGYPITRIVGLIMWSFAVWISGSLGIHFNKTTIFFSLLLLFSINFFLFIKSKNDIIRELRNGFSYLFKIELLALILFVFFLLIRFGNPDLWHPYKGGEKPMDFAYFNAVLKSTIFPPYDPWFSGGYINYYYFGFVLAAVPVKLLGIVPSFAYNLILPTLFSFSGLSVFCIGWNVSRQIVVQKLTHAKDQIQEINKPSNTFTENPYLVGLLVLLLFLIVGNLGTIRMISQGFQKIGATSASIESGNIIQKWTWFFTGITKFIGGQRLPYYPGDWYWIPSRIIPGEAITEFPFFTFLYGDLHAHLFALPVTLLVVNWCISLLNLNKNIHKDYLTGLPIVLFIGALIVGTLRPTNTWDFPAYLLICVLSIFYIGYQKCFNVRGLIEYFPNKVRMVIFTILAVIMFIGISILLYMPYTKSYGQAYTSVDIWKGTHTPINSYLTHWGFFLFVTLSWIIWEVREWMANTPLYVLKKVVPFKNLLLLLFALFIFVVTILCLNGIQISLIVLPILVILICLFLTNQPVIKKFVVLLSILGLALSFMVEVIVLRGDIGRMNTVFKFYFQAWTMLSISSAIYLSWLLNAILKRWNLRWKKIWFTVFLFLSISITLFPLVATLDKMTDRIRDAIPPSLDGMNYMKYATYSESDTLMDLSEDYYAIQWMQENIIGSPIIVEGNVPEYRWGNRYSIYTGLPGVIGWNWHQRQQRAIIPGEWITSRIDDVSEFYSTEDISTTKKFLEKYKVSYIIVGQLERIIYSKDGINKFDQNIGVLWNKVFQYANTSIYQVFNY